MLTPDAFNRMRTSDIDLLTYSVFYQREEERTGDPRPDGWSCDPARAAGVMSREKIIGYAIRIIEGIRATQVLEAETPRKQTGPGQPTTGEVNHAHL